MPLFVSPRLNRKWELERDDAAAYSSARRKLVLICAGIDGPDAELYTSHSPKNFLPAAATQLNFATRERNAIGHWPINSRMGERYDRSVCAIELLVRNAIIRKMAAGWNMVDSFHRPESVSGAVRKGKGPDNQAATIVEPSRSLVDSNLAPSTQYFPAPVDDQLGGVSDELESETKPCEQKGETP